MIRDEQSGDATIIRTVVTDAFEPKAYSDGEEPDIVNMLRRDGALTVSLVALEDSQIVGHIAFSKIDIDGAFCHWYGLGPVAVTPAYQSKGIGSALVNAGLDRLKSVDAQGCVLLGSPTYYARFGFQNDPDLTFSDAPAEFFQALNFTSNKFSGKVTYHPAFYI